MGAQRKRRRRRREEEREEQGLEPEPKVATPAAPADRALELQKTAGNRAVGAAIARWGLPWVPTAVPAWPQEPQVIIDGTVLPISSFTWSESQGGPSAGAGEARPDGDASITTTMGDHTAALMQKTADGSNVGKVIVVMPSKHGTGFTITLTDVYFVSYQHSGQLETWRLHFEKREFSQSPPPPPAGR